MTKDWLSMTASALGRGIEVGNIDPVELMEMYIETAKNHQFSDKIFARFTEARALNESNLSRGRARKGTRKSLLDGVPISWKDLFDTAGVATEAGSLLLEKRIPEFDADVLKNATDAGLVCFGKTHMSELAFSGLGVNPITNTPPCVNDFTAAPGGSSSGAAASVAFNLAAAGIGSDTGGSVRIPAAWNDLVGLKTTIGRLSVRGTVPLNPDFDTVGPLCRSTEDALHLLCALEGRKVPNLQSIEVKNLKLMILKTGTFDDVCPEVAEGFERVLDALKDQGASVVDRDIVEVESAQILGNTVFPAGAYGTWKAEIEAAPQLMFPEILDRFRGGRDVLASDYIHAWIKLRELRHEWLNKTSEYDAVILPTSQILPPNIKFLENDGDYYKKNNLLALKNTRIGNLMGLASLTLPTGVPSTGFMLMSGPNSEDILLSIGAAIEKIVN